MYATVAKPVIDGIMKGFNGTILAYGQTGTGKTYTMIGKLQSKHKKGIMSRSLDDIFTRLEADQKYQYSVKLAYLQIYKETI